MYNLKKNKSQLLRNYSKRVPIFAITKGVPKIIHQTYRTKNLSKELSDNVEFLKLQNPDWEYRLYDDNDIEEYIELHYGNNILKYYKRINPTYGAAKADLFRYLLMYKTGGVYLDIKSSLTKPLDETLLPGDQLILSHWDNEPGRQHENWGHYKEIKFIPQGEYQQWHIIAAAGHPFLREVVLRVLKNIDAYNPYRSGVGLNGTLKMTGPIVYSQVMHELVKTNPHYRLVDGTRDIGLRYSIYEEKMGYYYHKMVLNSNYNDQITPIVDNGIRQGGFYRFYFSQIHKRFVEYERKTKILQREMKQHPNKLSFFLYWLMKKLKTIKK